MKNFSTSKCRQQPVTKLCIGAAFGLLLMSTLLSQTASAQVVAPSRNEGVQGPGIAAGEHLVWHPAAEVEGGYVSNVFYQASNAIGAGILRITGRIDLASRKIAPEDPALADLEGEMPKPPSPRDVELRIGARFSYEEMLSSRETVKEQRNFNFDVNGLFEFRKERPLSFSLEEVLIRDVRPRNFEDTTNNRRISNSLIGAVTWAPGGGVLWGTFRYQNFIDAFEGSENKFANRMNHTLGLQGNWRWLPYTRVFADVSYGFYGPLEGSQLNGEPFKASSQPLRGVGGIATNLTELMTAKVRLGWARSNYSFGTGYNGFVAGAEWGLRYAPQGRVLVEYELDRYDSINSNFFRDHRFEGRIEHRLFSKLDVGGNLAVRLRRYEGIPSQIGAATRDDFLLGIGARVGYSFADRFSATLQYLGTTVETDYRTTFGGLTDDPSYGRDEVTLTFRAAF